MSELALFPAYAAIAPKRAIKHKRQDTITTMIPCLCDRYFILL